MTSDPTSAADPGQAKPAAKKPADLLPRVLSALVLVPLALALTWWGVVPFAAMALLVGLVMTWEWSRVVRGTGTDFACIVQGVTVLVATALAATGYFPFAVVAVIVAVLIVTALRLGQDAGLSALGIGYAALPVLALIWLRADEPLGFKAVLYLFLVVWTTDIGAFVAGRGIGGPKLWPRVSPNKTWAGLIGGIGAAAVVGGLFASLVLGAPPWRLALLAFVLGLVAQAGDLAESALKRSFGVKDTSALIPGHGGFMDRMDSLVTVSVVVALLGLLVNMRNPAQALLFGS